MRAPQPQTRPTTPSLLTFGSSDIVRNGATLTEPWASCGCSSFVSVVLPASPVALCRLRARLPRRSRANDTPVVTVPADRKPAR